MCVRLNNWAFESLEVKNRLWESSKLSKQALALTRLACLIFLLELNVLSVFLYCTADSWRVFSLTSVHIVFALAAHALLFVNYFFTAPWLWKLAHVTFEISFSFSLGLAVSFACVVVPVALTVKRGELADLEEGWVELTIRVQLHSAVLVLHLLDFYTNRIEFPLRHVCFVLVPILIFLPVCIGVSTIDKEKDAYTGWSEADSIGTMMGAGGLVLGGFCCSALVSECKRKRRALEEVKAKDVAKKSSEVKLSFASA
eukprot:TRINITY_DN5655_c0_g1_i3.p1 TRINITY_DN5655_c0_g1~~TRINITY_DN5655_c0_g1_i3.p1  ORF type:complete len:256 (+),score=47.88 TRINITY_DN5655_c0_g1_i3:178-945(+)